MYMLLEARLKLKIGTLRGDPPDEATIDTVTPLSDSPEAARIDNAETSDTPAPASDTASPARLTWVIRRMETPE